MNTDSIDIHERLAALETMLETYNQEREESRDEIKALNEKMDKMAESLVHYKGFVGGVVFVFGCLAAFLKLIPINLGFGK